MTQEEKLNKIEALSKMIINLKNDPKINSKKTIQKLQQELDEIAKS